MSIINEQIAGYTAKMQELFDSFNDDFPLVSENLKELDKIVDQIENISFMNSNARTFLQKVEYQKMYGIMPSEKDLDNLFFLTDLRRAGKNEILFVDQLQLSQNLYTLAQYYPEYYKLDEKSDGLGSTEYNDKLEDLRNALKEDFKKLKGEDATYIKDAILNGAVEQAIYEIKGMPGQISTASLISNKDWYVFTDNINKVVHEISTVPFQKGYLDIPKVDQFEPRIAFGDYELWNGKISVGGVKVPIAATFTVGNISQTVHWERNAFNRAPETWDELLSEIKQGSDQEWKIQSISGSGYHMFEEDEIYIIKVHRDSGQEAIYSLKEGVLRPENSTYNYGSQTNPLNSAYSGIHRDYDMSPHNMWLQSETAYKDMLENDVMPITDEEAVQKSDLAFDDKEFLRMYEDAKKEIEAANKHSLLPDKKQR